MSSSVQLKLLTLLNVSAIKRPFDHERPGGSRSISASVEPQAPSPIPSSTSTGLAGAAASVIPQANGQTTSETSQEPPRKKRKSVQWNAEMEIGPSGSKMNGNGKSKPAKQQKESGTAKVEFVTSSTAEFESTSQPLTVVEQDEGDSEDEAAGTNNAAATASDPFITHFAVTPSILTATAQKSAEANEWHSSRRIVGGLGRMTESLPGKVAAPAEEFEAEGSDTGGRSVRITPQLLTSFNMLNPTPSAPLSSTLDIVSEYKDLFVNGLDGDADGFGKGGFGEETEDVRRAGILHALNHVLKTRRKIIRNNEKLAHAAADPSKADPNFDPRDQSFTRPKVLLLLPFRSLALHYLTNHLFPLAPPGTQIENRLPFLKSFSLPDDASDPLDASVNPSAASSYPADHRATFKGNSDDNFRLGLKFTRKAWRVILPPAGEDKLIGCDIIVASPLALRMAAEKEKGTDSLSSIEVLIADGLDVMAMQNWEHVQFVFDSMNKIPNQPHGCDFSRVKPWYLETQAKFLRQSLLISRFETPEIRALYNRGLVNLEGKIRLERSPYPGILDQVRKGVKQMFTRLPGNDPLEELDQRFKFFVDTTLPALLKSAVCRINTMIMVPSYFDFVRVVNHLRKMENISFAAISEYSSNQEISRARTSFFKGKKAFLVVTERFHFYRRYRLRGAKTLVFYSIPDHASFYTELLAGPFIPSASGKETIEVDESDVTARVAFSKFDYLKLERIVGTEDARRMVTDEETKFTFI